MKANSPGVSGINSSLQMLTESVKFPPFGSPADVMDKEITGKDENE